jgi:hypothetical protein
MLLYNSAASPLPNGGPGIEVLAGLKPGDTLVRATVQP